MKTFQARDLDAFAQAVSEIAKLLPKSAVLLISGEMAAGKTTWIRFFLEQQGVKISASPTFALHHQYVLKHNNSIHEIDHWDLYRVTSEEDLETTGFWENVYQAQGLCLIEWPERLDFSKFSPPRPVYHLKISVLGNDERELKLQLAD